MEHLGSALAVANIGGLFDTCYLSDLREHGRHIILAHFIPARIVLCFVLSCVVGAARFVSIREFGVDIAVRSEAIVSNKNVVAFVSKSKQGMGICVAVKVNLRIEPACAVNSRAMLKQNSTLFACWGSLWQESEESEDEAICCGRTVDLVVLIATECAHSLLHNRYRGSLLSCRKGCM